jgi:hypothetical protein
MNQIQLFGINHNSSHLKFSYTPIILYNIDNKKIYQCPKCKFISGTLAPLYPNKLSVFIHAVDCPNTKSIPIEFIFYKI